MEEAAIRRINSLVLEELLGDGRVHILLPSLECPQDIALDDCDLVPVVTDLSIVHFNLVLQTDIKISQHS